MYSQQQAGFSSGSPEQGSETAAAMYGTLRRPKPLRGPWWNSPHPFFCIPSAMFWIIMLWTYVKLQHQLPELRDGLSAQDKSTMPCNEAHRRVATCAHRGNAAELLAKAGVSPQSASVLQHMQLLWKAGIVCFDMDVIHLRGGDMIVGHPADLAARLDPSALPAHGSSSSNKPPAKVTADKLHRYSLQELRAAGLSEQTAPTLQALLQQFRELLDSGLPSSGRQDSSSATVLSAHKAAELRSWVDTPVISLEPKGPAAVDVQAFMRVTEVAVAAGVSQHTVLWLRQMSADSNAVVVTELARAVKQGQENITSRTGQGQAAVGLRPLLGLIVADMLLLQSELSAVQQSGDAGQLATALLAAAGGMLDNSESPQDGAAVVASAFDVWAPSIKLPPQVLHSFVASKPCLAWTLEDEGHARRAMWLGIDVAITNTPVSQLALVREEESTICNS